MQVASVSGFDAMTFAIAIGAVFLSVLSLVVQWLAHRRGTYKIRVHLHEGRDRQSEIVSSIGFWQSLPDNLFPPVLVIRVSNDRAAAVTIDWIGLSLDTGKTLAPLKPHERSDSCPCRIEGYDTKSFVLPADRVLVYGLTEMGSKEFRGAVELVPCQATFARVMTARSALLLALRFRQAM